MANVKNVSHMRVNHLIKNHAKCQSVGLGKLSMWMGIALNVMHMKDNKV